MGDSANTLAAVGGLVDDDTAGAVRDRVAVRYAARQPMKVRSDETAAAINLRCLSYTIPLTAGSSLAEALYWMLREALGRDGVGDRDADRMALRMARAAVSREIGFNQVEIAKALKVTERTVRSDVAYCSRLRGSELESFRGRRLSRVPALERVRFA